MAKFGDKPELVSLYFKAAALAFEPAFKTTGEVSYETSLGQVNQYSIRLIMRYGAFKELAFRTLLRNFEWTRGESERIIPRAVSSICCHAAVIPLVVVIKRQESSCILRHFDS